MHTMSKGQLMLTIALVLLAAFTMFTVGAAEGVMLATGAALTLEDVTKEFKTKSDKLESLADNLKGQNEELTGRLVKSENIATGLKTRIDETLIEFNTTKTALTELEQKLSQRASNEPEAVKSWGEQFVGGDSFKGAGDSPGQRRGTIGQSVKQVTSAAAGGLIRSHRETDVVSLLRERRVVRDLLNTIPVNTSSVDYAIQTSRTNAAAPVAEGAAKPYSDYAWDSATVVVRTLAHLAKITRQAMDDAPRLMGEIDAEMRYGLGYVEERQFLYGSNIGQNLHGIIPQASAFAVPAGFPVMANATRVDILRIAMLQASMGLLPADGIVLHELDWAVIELTKTTDGAYLFANPQGNVEARMWGLPVVATPAMVVGDFLVGAFKVGATVYDRMGVEVLISTENDKDFENNLATMRAEERVAIAVKRPQAFITGGFTAALADATA